MQINDFVFIVNEFCSSLRKHVHAVYIDFFSSVKIEISPEKNDIFNVFAQNILCGYMLEPPHRGSSNEYPQSMFWSENKKNRYTPAYPVLLYKSGV